MNQSIDIYGILKHIPHRYPFLLVDKVLEYEVNAYLVGLKNVTVNEPFFQGHFPNRPVMPGVLMMEALAQASGMLSYLSVADDPENPSTCLFAGIDNARFKRVVYPGDQLTLRTKLLKVRRSIWMFHCEATVGKEVAAVADLICARQEGKK